MTTYAQDIVLTEQPTTAELYQLIEARDQFRYYTSFERNIVYNGMTYVSAPIKRSPFTLESSLKTIEVKINAPVSEMFGEFLANAPYKSSYVIITKVFIDSPDTKYQLLFSGVIGNVTLKDGTAMATCKSQNNRLAQKLPRGFYQTNCNHTFLDDGCAMTGENYTFDMTVSVVSGADITLAEMADIPSGTFQGGTLANGFDERLITSQVAGKCTILIPFTDTIEVGQVLQVKPGCDGSCGICKGYDNLNNFFGFPYIPTKNAVIWGFR